MNQTVKIGAQIRFFRKYRGLSQEQLADLVQCSPKTISHMENDKGSPDLRRLVNICNALEIRVNELFLKQQ